ncbi:hypothetical protein CDSM653_01111 [Caldanaerobacter subterraneus subsp. pacificus DSM 12653]|uniref:Uncharacterized protein n=1 Tax=Caldanaerobacter subterraneus subsp. pacificus DSM 12653 TaxID=391606 RepID=A0A0F5PMI0_9THEO|nr:hypothetical protein CDSM653_01111 [Caldanaerobacter subterraneus subsp. pacificus DSM 12653]
MFSFDFHRNSSLSFCNWGCDLVFYVNLYKFNEHGRNSFENILKIYNEVP